MGVKASRKATKQRRSAAPAVAVPRGALAAMLALALAGVAVAAVLAWVHLKARAGGASFCNYGDALSCDRVALSPQAVQLGVPVAVWGVLGYALMAGLAASGLLRRRAGGWPTGILFALSAAAAGVSVALAVVSKVAIGVWCPLCVVSWVISFGLLAVAWRACRARGVRRVLAEDLGVLRSHPFSTGGVLVLLVAVLALARQGDATPPAQAPELAGAAAPPAAPGPAGPIRVIEYSDYECPSCARMHEQTRPLIGRPDVELVRRHFPLDSSCNPSLQQRVHERACELARAAICAEAQGRFAAMDDALFDSQRAPRPVEALAAQVGLDPPRFRACLASPETERRLAADVQAGIRDGVRGTPTFVLGDKVFTGVLPPELVMRLGAVPGR